MTSDEVLTQAQAGSEEAFATLVAPYRRELQAHCYRLLASAQDAEDTLQETLLDAWRALDSYEQRASLRTWLYRIATNRALNTMRSASRRPTPATPAPDWIDPAARTRRNEVMWLEPYPDLLLDGLADQQPGPHARYEAKEAISLAFVTALQLLPPQQRAVLVLRDVLGFSAKEAAEMLDTTTDAANSALKRARATLARQTDHATAAPATDVERRLVDQLTEAYASGDIDTLLGLLAEDVRLAMPPLPFEYEGIRAASQMLDELFSHGTRYALIETRANGQPAFGVYVRDPHTGLRHAAGLMVLTLHGPHIAAMTHFDKSVLSNFGLPRTLPR